MDNNSVTNGNVSFWYNEVGFPEPTHTLTESLTADVCIVGAGYTGMWTAYYLKKAAPQLRIVLLERKFAGYGASGRNGGWLTNTVTGGRDKYVASHGRDSAAVMQQAMNATVDEVIRVCAIENIDADIIKGGELNAAFNPAQHARLMAWASDEHSWGYDDVRVFWPRRNYQQNQPARSYLFNLASAIVHASSPRSWHRDYAESSSKSELSSTKTQM